MARIGITDAPADTRVYFSYLDVFSRRTSLRVVLGQAIVPGPNRVRFRLELDGLNTRDVRLCDQDEQDVSVCGKGDGTVEVASDPGDTSLILTGDFDSHGSFNIDIEGLYLYSRAEGPYRLFQQEFLPFEDEPVSEYRFPARGVEVKPAVDIDPSNRRYDSVTPDPHRLYPDGWAFLVEHPGGPVDVRVTDVAGEVRLKRRRDLYGLFTGIFSALAAEGAMLMAFHREQAPRPRSGD